MKNQAFLARMGFAISGWRAAWQREHSFRTQIMIAIVAVAALIVLRPAPIWWAIVILTCALVLALELVNSAVEALVAMLHPGIHPEIKALKDMLAGAVLAISLAAVFVGVALAIDRLPVIFGFFS